MTYDIYLILDNIRSAHNVGAILRTAEGIGVKKVFLCGYTPYPKLIDDPRLPYLADKINARIAKTALGAETTQSWEYRENILELAAEIKQEGYLLTALEQNSLSISLNTFKPNSDIALILGNEVEGVNKDLLNLCDVIVEIGMKGSKESFNVAASAAMALYYLTNML